MRAGGHVARLARSRPSWRAPSRHDNGPICITLSGQKTHTGYYADLQGGLRLVNGSHDNAIRGDQFAADKGYAIGSAGNGFFADPCTRANQPFSPVEARWAAVAGWDCLQAWTPVADVAVVGNEQAVQHFTTSFDTDLGANSQTAAHAPPEICEPSRTCTQNEAGTNSGNFTLPLDRSLPAGI